jgi:hypothetical protein
MEIRPQCRDAGNALFQLGKVDPGIHGRGAALFVLFLF